jgi:hypothetical protein
VSDNVIDALVKLAPAVIALHAIKPNRCILATRVGCEVLRYFDVPHEPLVVNVKLVNAAMYAWGRDGYPGGAEAGKALGAHMIEVHESVPGPGWSGHLVIEVAGGIVDLDLQQFQRPAKAIDLPHAASFATSTAHDWVYEINGSHLWYIPRRGDTSFMRARDWYDHGDRMPAASLLIRAIKQHLERADAG